MLKKIRIESYSFFYFYKRSCLKLKGKFERNILISVTKLDFSIIAEAMLEKLAKDQWNQYVTRSFLI